MGTFEVQNKMVLVTGASSGIGKEFAKQLAEQKAGLVLVARSGEKLEKLAASLIQQYGIQAHVCVADLSNPEGPQSVFQWLESNQISVDVLINNAGFGRKGPFEAGEVAGDEAMLQVNINSLVALTHLLIPGMLKKQSGGILNVASTASFQPIPYLGLYAATKAFVLSFTEALWGEYRKRGIRIFCLCPGNTITAFHQQAGIEKNRVFLAATVDATVQYALRKFINTSSPTGVHGFMNYLGSLSSRLVPRRVVAWVAGLIYYKKIQQ